MNEPIRKYFKPGLIQFMAHPQTMKSDDDVLETLKSICMDDFFDVVEITHISDDNIRQKAKEIIDVSGMICAYGAQPRLLINGLNPNAIDENERMKAVKILKESIDEAIFMGAKGMAFLSGKYEDKTKDMAYQALIKTTIELCEYAKSKSDIKIALEVFDFDVDKCSLIGPAQLAAKYAKEVCSQYDNFGLMVDLSHLPLLRESVKESILPVKDYIIHAHLGNAVTIEGMPAFGDAHPRFGFENGSNDVPEIVEFMKFLLDIGFLNTKNPPIVSFEVKPFEHEDPRLVVANAKRKLLAAWAQV